MDVTPSFLTWCNVRDCIFSLRCFSPDLSTSWRCLQPFASPGARLNTALSPDLKPGPGCPGARSPPPPPALTDSSSPIAQAKVCPWSPEANPVPRWTGHHQLRLVLDQLLPKGQSQSPRVL